MAVPGMVPRPGAIAVNWWEIPHDLPFFQTKDGVPLPQKENWHTRAVVFDAFAYIKFLNGTKPTGEEGGSDNLPPSYPWPDQGGPGGKQP